MTNQKRKKHRKDVKNPVLGKCLRCGANEPHFVGPSFGDPGFYICPDIPKPVDLKALRNAQDETLRIDMREI